MAAVIERVVPELLAALTNNPVPKLTAVDVRKFPLPSAVRLATTVPPPEAAVVNRTVAPGYGVTPSIRYAVPATVKEWQPRQSRPALWLDPLEVLVLAELLGLVGDPPPQAATVNVNVRRIAIASTGRRLMRSPLEFEHVVDR
jgi:hypothetical protein